MSLFEGIGAMSEHLVMVLDIGTAYTKFGVAGEYEPRCIIPSEVKCSRTGKIRRLTSYNDKDDLHDLLVDFLHVVFFEYGLNSPKDRSIVVVESLLCPTLFRETLAKVLFCYYEVSMLLMLPSHLVSVATLAADTALVLDIGYGEAISIPVCHGVAVLDAWQALPLAGSAVHSELKSMLSKVNSGLELSEDVLEDIKVRCCFVTTLERSTNILQDSSSFEFCPSVSYPLGETNITVPGFVRETSYESLFRLDNDFQTLPTMILDTLIKVKVDLRKPLSENIFLTGGTSMASGLKSRLKEELYKLLKHDKYKKLAIEKFKFHTAPAKDNYTAWLGGSIYGNTEMVSLRSMTRFSYFKENRLPDWVNLLDNRDL